LFWRLEPTRKTKRSKCCCKSWTAARDIDLLLILGLPFSERNGRGRSFGRRTRSAFTCWQLRQSPFRSLVPSLDRRCGHRDHGSSRAWSSLPALFHSDSFIPRGVFFHPRL
jgi:hypothetical protein